MVEKRREEQEERPRNLLMAGKKMKNRHRQEKENHDVLGDIMETGATKV